MNNEIKEQIWYALNDNKNIFVVGARGTGKTTVLNDVFNSFSNDKILINGKLSKSEFWTLKDQNISNIYYICLVIKKIMVSIKDRYYEKYLKEFTFFEMYIDSIIKQIYSMVITDVYKNENNLISDEIYDYPEILLERFLGIVYKKIDTKDLIYIVDGFDEIGNSSMAFQKLMYNKVMPYLRMIITFSDNNVVHNKLLLDGFSVENDIIEIDYSYNVNIVRNILDKEVKNSFIRNRRLSMKYNLNFILTDDTIELMIKKTDGNLFDMLYALKTLYYHIEELNISEYNTYIIDFIDNVINSNPMITGIFVPERKLHIGLDCGMSK